MKSLFENPQTHVQTEQVKIVSDPGFVKWLDKEGTCIALTTYQAGKILFFGVNDKSELFLYNRNFERCMALHVEGPDLYLSSLYQLIRFRDALADTGGTTSDNFDCLYVPKVSWFTSDLDIHSIEKGEDGRPVFVNTLFSCISEVSDKYSFQPLWQPPFISKLAAEDRCHLNGMAMVDGKKKYVSMVAQTDLHEGWRDHRVDGGAVMDVTSGQIVCDGLSMPHNPFWHDDTLYLHQAGTGEFGKIDLDQGKFKPLVFLPGFLRGLSFVGLEYALAGTSLPRVNKTFSGLPIPLSIR